MADFFVGDKGGCFTAKTFTEHFILVFLWSLKGEKSRINMDPQFLFYSKFFKIEVSNHDHGKQHEAEKDIAKGKSTFHTYPTEPGR